ncbi:hypothetical protein PtA15_17A105 [Puccinia triticina]|uniref:Uncharacterized protein n=1 Tax=Puccinia triticina TaxID=208348 RepID=A0ABY7D7S2_9BASI|nr:uncharacterized protein PtA15_17A105 [Puccinia triticina]WAQ92623.1 hypothetical protein PtA15_17A105 [Puccinia triticina]
MRGIVRSGPQKFEVVSTLNVQHDCHTGGCEVSATGRVRVERQESKENHATVVHKNAKFFVVNSGELPRNQELVSWVDLPSGEEDIQDVIPGLEDGLAAWVRAGGALDDEDEDSDPSVGPTDSESV